MECNNCKRVIKSAPFFHKGVKKYYCNELCYIESLGKEYTKKIRELFNYYMSDNDKTFKVPQYYFIKLSNLKKILTDSKYLLYYLYNIRDEMFRINKENRLKDSKIRMWLLWKYIDDNIFTMLEDFYRKKEDISYLFQNEDKEVKIPVRRKNKLLED